MSNAFPSLALHCLGPPWVRVDGREAPPDVLWRKHLALLTYLALSPDGTRSRTHLLGLLWPESPDVKARRSLNEAVRRLRSALGTERLLTHGASLQLNATDLEVDVRQCERLRAEGQVRALGLLRGEFLEGFHVDDAPVCDDWMDTQRAQIRQAATALVVARAEEQLAVNRYVEARALARRALARDPFNEPALALGMRSAALEGDSTGALALYHDVAERLARDIGETPSGALSALAAGVRAGRWRRPGTRHSDPEPPLIGRREAHAQLFARLDRYPREGPACLVIVGDPGSGRTRLLDACTERLALAGATVATARLLESDHDAPWSTLRALMRGGLQLAPGLTGTDHIGLRVLAGIVPELAERVPPLAGGHEIPGARAPRRSRLVARPERLLPHLPALSCPGGPFLLYTTRSLQPRARCELCTRAARDAGDRDARATRYRGDAGSRLVPDPDRGRPAWRSASAPAAHTPTPSRLVAHRAARGQRRDRENSAHGTGRQRPGSWSVCD